MSASPTSRTYNGLDGAYSFFNQRLFSATLPDCLITLQRKIMRTLEPVQLAGPNLPLGDRSLPFAPATRSIILKIGCQNHHVLSASAVRTSKGQREVMRLKLAPIAAFLACLGVAANAMQIAVAGDELILSGQVVGDETSKVADILAANPTITTVILRNSPGGDVPAGYAIGEMLRMKGLRTAISGYCYSSCSRMFLGGRTRIFTNDYPPEYTNVGFHGHYKAGGLLDAEAVRRYGLKDWIIKYSDGKADPALVEKWVNIPESHDLIHFYHPIALQGHGATTFFCHGNEPRIFGCEAISRTALDLGIITSLDIITSNDRPKP
ncbi:MAG: hypothetical protein ABSC06_14035 [Rhodopila sp.]